MRVHRFRKRIRLIVALATASAGIANMVSAIVPRLNWDVLFGAWPVDAPHGVHKLIVVVGFFLLMPWWSRLGSFKTVPDRITFAH